MGLPKILRSLTQQPESVREQWSRYSLWWIRSPSGSRQSRISLAQQWWLAVNTITSYLPLRACSISIAPGLMLIPASAVSPFGNLIVIFRSWGCSTDSLQWIRVQSMSKTMVFLSSQPLRLGRSKIFSAILARVGIFEFSIDFRICRLVVRCSLAGELGSWYVLSTSDTQYWEEEKAQGSLDGGITEACSCTWVTIPPRESCLQCQLVVQGCKSMRFISQRRASLRARFLRRATTTSLRFLNRFWEVWTARKACLSSSQTLRASSSRSYSWGRSISMSQSMCLLTIIRGVLMRGLYI